MHFVWRLAILLMVGLAPSASFAREPLPRSVLYLDENDPGLPFAQGISAAFRAALNARSAERIAVYAENLHLVRSSGPRYEEILKTYLREKYRDRPIGVITTIGPAALTFMLRARPELWPDVPAIFASVDPETAAQVQIPVGVTGLVRRQTVRDSVSVARALMPNLKRIALVGDRLERQNFRRHFEEEIPLLAAEVEIIDLTGLPMVELRKRVATLPEDTVIYFTTLTFDGDRPAYISRDALVSIAEVANRPIVVDLEPNVGYGGVGGLVADPDRIGSEAARLVLRILNGESAADIPVLAGNFVRPVFDWGELRRWNVSEHRLPAGSDVLFRQPGLWEQYKWYILAAAALVVIEAAFIVALLANRRRLQASEDRISLAADAANLRCWVHDLVTDQTWATQTGRNMLGWWPSRPFAFEQFMERVHPDDRESVRRAVQRSREDRTDYEAEYRLVVPGVGTRWVAARGRCEFDRDGKPLRMRGVNVDITKRRQAEEALRASEQRMGLAADAADLYCWEWEIPSDQVWTTGTGRNALDWRPSRPLTFEQVMERVHPDDRESMRQALQRSVEGGGDYEVDYRLVAPGVDTRWLAARGRCEFDRDGKPLRMRGVTIDITKRRQAEEALIASEQRVSLAADAANLRCWVHDLVTDQMWATQTGRNVLGWWPSRPLTFEQFMERVHPDDRQSVRRAVQRSREDRSDYEAEYRLVVPSVGTRWVAARGRCEFDCDGKPLRMRGVTIDITKRRQAEEALIASEQRVSLAADAASLRCWEYDIQSDQLWATQTDRNMLGWWPSRPLTFEQFTERVHPDDRESVRRAVQRSREDRSDYEAEYRLVVPGGGTRWVAARGRREFDRDGKPLRMRGVTIDITKRRQAEEAARELSGRLINAQEEERSRLARELHDDVTQRLALLAIDAGRGERNLPSAAGGTAMRAMRESLIRLSEDVHALAYRLHPSILEDLGLIEALKTECERFGRVASIPVDLKAQEVPDPLPHAVALCLYRIAQEALRNVGRHARASAVQVSLRRLDGGVQLAVRDNGAGFDPAQQRDRPSLGHASMRQRVYQLNGELEVESAPGHGTTVLAWVPLKEEQSEPSARAAG